jgi:hypothetical protein
MDQFDITKWNKNRYLVEAGEGTSQANELAKLINSAIDSIDDNLSYKDFAMAVAIILKDEYGSHNFEPFMGVLHGELGMNESLNEYGEYNDIADSLQAEMRKLFGDSVYTSMGSYGDDRPDSDPLKGKGYGQIFFRETNDLPDNEWKKVINFLKSKGFEITSESNYYEEDPGERIYYPKIQFHFNRSEI